MKHGLCYAATCTTNKVIQTIESGTSSSSIISRAISSVMFIISWCSCISNCSWFNSSYSWWRNSVCSSEEWRICWEKWSCIWNFNFVFNIRNYIKSTFCGQTSTSWSLWWMKISLICRSFTKCRTEYCRYNRFCSYIINTRFWYCINSTNIMWVVYVCVYSASRWSSNRSVWIFMRFSSVSFIISVVWWDNCDIYSTNGRVLVASSSGIISNYVSFVKWFRRNEIDKRKSALV